MKKHLKALLAGAAVAGSILACTAAYARFSDSVTVTNHISVGDINISLRELEKKGRPRNEISGSPDRSSGR